MTIQASKQAALILQHRERVIARADGAAHMSPRPKSTQQARGHAAGSQPILYMHRVWCDMRHHRAAQIQLHVRTCSQHLKQPRHELRRQLPGSFRLRHPPPIIRQHKRSGVAQQREVVWQLRQAAEQLQQQRVARGRRLAARMAQWTGRCGSRFEPLSMYSKYPHPSESTISLSARPCAPATLVDAEQDPKSEAKAPVHGANAVQRGLRSAPVKAVVAIQASEGLCKQLQRALTA